MFPTAFPIPIGPYLRINEYFDFLQAVDGYKFDQGALFLTYLEYHLKTSFSRALGLRTSKDKKNSMRYAMSLDAPVEGTEDLTLQDMIIDHMSEEDLPPWFRTERIPA
jgi:ribosomal protein L32